METDYIPEFIALAEYGSSYLAAEKLFISQSSLLRHVQSIEDEFGMPLFDRTRKGFVLNTAGQVFLPYAKQIAGLKNHCYDILHHEEESGKTVRLYAEGKIIDMMIDFRKIHTDINLSYSRPDNPEEALFNGEIDVAFLTNLTPRMADHFRTIPYTSEEVLVLLYEGHPLAEKDSISMDDLYGEDYIALAQDVVITEQFAQRFINGRGPNVVAAVPVGADLVRMVREKLGISLFHGQSGMIPPAPGLAVRPLNPAIRYDMNIYYRKDAPLGRATESFLNFAKRWVSVHRDINRSLIEN